MATTFPCSLRSASSVQAPPPTFLEASTKADVVVLVAVPTKALLEATFKAAVADKDRVLHGAVADMPLQASAAAEVVLRPKRSIRHTMET